MFKALNKKGVTLVELLAVVVIMGIIAAIAVPTVGGLIQAQRDNAAAASWDQVEEAAKLYAASESDNSVTLADLIAQEYITFNTVTYVLTSGASLTVDAAILPAAITLDVSGSTVSIEIGNGATTAINLYVNEVLVGTDSDA